MKDRLKELQSRYQPGIDKFLREFLGADHGKKSSFCSEMSAYQLATGGKRLRALIPCLIYEILGETAESAIPLGAAAELFHNATLVHDDLQDSDQMRRGHPTVWKRYGQAQAINCGDALFQYGCRALLEMPMDSGRKLRILDLAVQSTTKVIEGQAQEFLMKNEKHPDVQRYVSVARGKTSALFVFSAVAPLLALGAAPSLRDLVERAVIELGVLFQIHDDLLDIYGHKGRERSGTDLAEGKVSVLAAHVFETGGHADQKELHGILRLPREETTAADVQRAIRIFERCDSKHHAENLIESIRARALKSVAGHHEAAPIIDELVALFS
ncbi:MAG: polyprenyl synthetase family protein [Deltaproteobacteria bacterium]|nr:polyprenyl synthetase family protein [Deltaproteobacteria bacterium]